MKHSSADKKTPTTQPFVHGNDAPVLADSLEVMEAYYLQNINGLTAALQDLTIVDDAVAIIKLCRAIKEQKRGLEKLMLRKRFC